MRLLKLVLVLAFMLAVPGTAFGARIEVTPVWPGSGTYTKETDQYGSQVQKTYEADYVQPSGAYNSYLFFEVATQAEPRGQDGTFASEYTIDSGYLTRGDAYPNKWKGTWYAEWLSKPGTYYLQYSVIGCVSGSQEPCLSDVFTLTVTEPAKPTPPPTTTAPPATAPPATTAQCGDGIDNDGDGTVDNAEDHGCTAESDNDERLQDLDIPSISMGEAKGYIKKTMRQRFGSAFRYGEPRISCDRLTYLKITCGLRWYIGDGGYRGRATARLYRVGEDIFWKVGYRITLTDNYCLDTRGRNCKKVYVG